MAEKPRMSVVMIGHVDSGKSTTTGHLLLECGGFGQQLLQRIEENRSVTNKFPSRYAYLIKNGFTIDTLWKCDTNKYTFTMIDTHGQRDIIKNMLDGTSYTEVVMLVVSSAKDEFEAGVSEQGQTQEHALLAHIFGVRQLLVLVNKMDHSTTNFSEGRFKEVERKISSYLSNIGYQPEMVTVIPISGWAGDNLIKKSDNMPWYSGPTVIEYLDSLQEPKRLAERPLRIPIQDVYKIGGIGTVPVGRVEYGVLNVKDQIFVAPGNLISEVRSIEMFHQTHNEAGPGDNIGFSVRGLKVKDMHRGCVVGHLNNEPPVEAIDFVAQIIVLNCPGEIHEGYAPMLHCHTSQVPCKFVELLAKYDKRTGKELEITPNVTALRKGDKALVRLEPTQPMVVEAVTEYPMLGRFAVRDMSRTVAVGAIISVNKKPHIVVAKK